MVKVRTQTSLKLLLPDSPTRRDDWRNRMKNVQTSDVGKKARSKAPFSLKHLNISINNAPHVSVVQEFSLLLQVFSVC